MSEVIVRFAPSPTGYLHIGGARTALFNWAYARGRGGRFILRIEDTDGERSSKAHSQAIMDSLLWLGLAWDGETVYQSQSIARHQEIARRLVDEGHAYYCDCTKERLETLRAKQKEIGGFWGYDRHCRGKGLSPSPDAVIRLKTPDVGKIEFTDSVFGTMTINNSSLDDQVILRADGKPTYNLANVADDIDMGITYVIRGDDHIMNTYRQLHLYSSLNNQPPQFAHFPMILGAVEKGGELHYERLSKRNTAVDVRFYREQGFLPEAMVNYLARLSWSCGDMEFFGADVLVKHFDFPAGQYSPARFDMDKLKWLNREHLKTMPPAALRKAAQLEDNISDAVLNLLAPRCETLKDVQQQSLIFINQPTVDNDLLNEHLSGQNRPAFDDLLDSLSALQDWDSPTLKQEIKKAAKAHGLRFAALGMPLRVLLTGKTESPDIAEVAAVLGRKESLRRLSCHSCEGWNPAQT